METQKDREMVRVNDITAYQKLNPTDYISQELQMLVLLNLDVHFYMEEKYNEQFYIYVCCIGSISRL